MLKPEYSVAFTDTIDERLQSFLLRPDGQEDLCFGLWTPSRGTRRTTALIHTVIYPGEGERVLQGNVAFTKQYFERVCETALREESGVALLHSHLGPGWQGMSSDDVTAETRIAGPVESLTNLPLVGLTLGTDGTWSARFWKHAKAKKFQRLWSRNVRNVGLQLRVSFADHLVPFPKFQEMFRRTVTVWGEREHANLVRLRIAIVGLGSVGSLVAETLVRMGFQNFVIIDFDEVQAHNLDRLVTATRCDIGKLKVDVTAKRMKAAATAKQVFIEKVPFSVVEEEGYRAALDCDVIFSCVDRPRARKILNHLAYAHLIPVIDGGIAVRFKNNEFSGVDWQVQTAAPGRVCLECLGTFTVDDAATEEAGMLDDPSYLSGLPRDHSFKRNENVFPFSENLASLEVFHLIALVTGAAGQTDFGVQRFRWLPGRLDSDLSRKCKDYCDIDSLVAQGDRHFCLCGRDLGAEAARARQSPKFKLFRKIGLFHKKV
jgi:molybdopterin/thiamine biosynthesis adenylyltransferase